MTIRDWVSIISTLLTIGGLVWYLASALSKLKGDMNVALVELRGKLESQDVMLENIIKSVDKNIEVQEKMMDNLQSVDRRVIVMETLYNIRHQDDDSK